MLPWATWALHGTRPRPQACAYAISVHFYARPFLDPAIDALDTFGQMSLLLLLLSGFMFSDPASNARYPWWHDLCLGIALVAVLGALAWILMLSLRNVYDTWVRRRPFPPGPQAGTRET